MNQVPPLSTDAPVIAIDAVPPPGAVGLLHEVSAVASSRVTNRAALAATGILRQQSQNPGTESNGAFGLAGSAYSAHPAHSTYSAHSACSAYGHVPITFSVMVLLRCP